MSFGRIGDDRDRHSRCIDPRGLQDPALDQLIEKIETAGLVLRLFDMMSDIAVPCFTAILGARDIHDDANVRFVEVTAGSGAHPSPVRAAIRAVAEAVRSRSDLYRRCTGRHFCPKPSLPPLPVADAHSVSGPFRRCRRRCAPAYPAISRSPSRLHAECLAGKANRSEILVLALSDPALPFSVGENLYPCYLKIRRARARRFLEMRAVSKAIMS